MTLVIISSCGKDDSVVPEKTNEVAIGVQVWMTENLNVEKFRNGDPIPEAKTDSEWKRAGENGDPAWCYFNNNPDNGDRYGKLYNFYAVNDPRGLAPEGWKIPSDEEWIRMVDFLGGRSVAGKKMKSIDFWADNGNESGNGTNQSGFSGLPGGYRFRNGQFYDIGKYGYWWSSTEYQRLDVSYRSLGFDDGDVGSGSAAKANGYSVRCIKD